MEQACFGNRFSVVLMDGIMPVMDGQEATRRVRAWEAEFTAQRTPIVALSGAVTPEEEKAFRAAGADDFLPKPVRLNDLNAMLNKYFRMSRDTIE